MIVAVHNKRVRMMDLPNLNYSEFQAYRKMHSVRVCYSAHGGMFYCVMRLDRTFYGRLALMLAMVLAVQGFAAPPVCAGSAAATSTMHVHCSSEHRQWHRHGCDNCCCAVAIALLPAHFHVPHETPAPITVTVHRFPRTVSIDRLDRPPRLMLL